MPFSLCCTLTINMGALTFPGEMKGSRGLKDAAQAAEIACHNTRWIKEHGGGEGRQVSRLYLFIYLFPGCLHHKDFICY